MFRFGIEDSQMDLYKQDYIKLYVDTIQPIVEQNDPTRSYTVSSPSNGLRTVEEGYISANPYSPVFGDGNYQSHLILAIKIKLKKIS